MKNLLIYTGPHKKFDEETSFLVKIQVDNSMDLGWRKKDILFIADFPYQYKRIKSIVIRDGFYYNFDKSSNKIPVIMHLFDQGQIEKDEFYWYHDFDVYQQEVISNAELGLGGYDIGITPYEYKPEWNLGSFFFKFSAKDIFSLINQDILNKRKSNNRCDEKALKRLIVRRALSDQRYRNLNVTYNFTKRCIATNYQKAVKPLKVLHFHPWDRDAMMSDTALNIFMYGKNRLRIPLMNDRLIKIFDQHGVK